MLQPGVIIFEERARVPKPRPETAIMLSVLSAAALLLVPVTDTYAKPNGANCVCAAGIVTHMGSDGSECTAECDGGKDSKATANATGDGSNASADVSRGGQAKAAASNDGDASSEADE